MKPLVCMGFLGPTLDGGPHEQRWNRWRPSVAICRHPDLLLARVELFYQRRYKKLLDQVLEDIARISPRTELRAHVIDIENPWDFEHVYGALHRFARTYEFDTDEEDYLLHITTGTHVIQICEFLLAESRHLPARLLQSSPPRRGDRRGGPGHYTIIDLDLSKYDQLFERFQQEQREGVSFLKAGIQTRNEAFNALIERIERVALASRDPMLLMGPTGAGKTMLARRIYELKRQRRQLQGRFVEVNCATLRGDGAMSALFGHLRGAYTGAIADRPGLLRAADGGVLFLDEVGELGLDEQAMLLRAIESGLFMPVGSDEEVQSDFQLIAGTNRDLREQVAAGEFREDLLARIDLWSFHLPGLRERIEDIEPNLEFELDRFTERAGERVTMNREARLRYLKFATGPRAMWRANFRDLSASVTRMATLAPKGRVRVETVDEEIDRLERAWRSSEPRSEGEQVLRSLLGEEGCAQLDRFDQVQLADVVQVCRQCRTLSEAGRRLFAVSRLQKKSNNDADRLRKYLARHGLDFDQITQA